MGWSVRRLEEARNFAREIGSTAVLIVQRGRLIAEWGDTRRRVKIHSMRKSFMSALFGIAVERRQIDLKATLQDLQIDDVAPSLTAGEKRAIVRDLLMARSGVYHEAAAETRSMEARRPARGSHAPGTFWYYNNWDFNALGTILRSATGEDTFAAMEKHLARPLGMEHFTAADGEYVRVPASEHPAYHMHFTALDLARFGWLLLNRGSWEDRQIVPASWVAESTKAWTPNARSGVAYGYMWWISMNDTHFRTKVGPGAYSARGNGGQFIVVAPARGIVVVHLNDQSENEKLESGEFNELMQLIFDAAPR
jgi:CubicO group peptidase (beta-lactamase class C family)